MEQKPLLQRRQRQDLFDRGCTTGSPGLTLQPLDLVLRQPGQRNVARRAAARTALRDVSKNVASFEIAPDGKRALFSARGDLFTVPAKHGATRNLTATPGVHERNPKWSHDGKRIYTANVRPGSVSVLDVAAHKTVTIIPIAGSTQRISISRDDRWVFTADQTQPRIAVIDTSTNAVKQWVTLPAVGYGSAVTLDGKYLLVAMPRAKQLAVVDLATMQVVHTTDLPAGGQGEIFLRPDGKVAYVSGYPGHQVAEIEVGSWNVARVIEVGQRGDGMAWVK